MVGFYADAPANRLAYDRDGTLGFNITSVGGITALTTPQMVSMNDENGGGGVAFASNAMCVLIFPELRDLTHVFREASNNVAATLESSVDTTNGFDGTWATVIASASLPTAATVPGYRVPTALSANNTSIKAIRYRYSSNGATFLTLHFFGKVSAASPTKLELWHPTLDQPLYDTPAALDYGDFPRNSSQDKTFRVKNRSTTLTAGTITLSREALTDAAGTTHVSEQTLSYNGGAFGATATIASLAPGAISNLCTLRMAPGAASVLGLWSQRVIASAASWT